MADSGFEKFIAGMFVGVLTGAATGAALGVLFAPRPGSETRQVVRERANEYIGAARERVENMRQSRYQSDVPEEEIVGDY